jgi:hypothetical protein
LRDHPDAEQLQGDGRHVGWTLILLGMLAVMIVELDFFFARTLDSDQPSVLWRALVV